MSAKQINGWQQAIDYTPYNDCIGEILNSSNNNITIKKPRRKFDQYVWWKNRK